MGIALLCEELGWDYEQYLRQPQWFIDRMRAKLAEDRKRQHPS